MNEIREWIMQLASVIVFGTVCDILIAEGEIKKYIKPAIGFVLVFTLLRPLGGLSVKGLALEILENSDGIFTRTLEGGEEIQTEKIELLYEKKLSSEISDWLKNEPGHTSDVMAETEIKKDGSADIKKIKMELFVQEGEFVNCELIKKQVGEKFGIEAKKITVTLTEKR